MFLFLFSGLEYQVILLVIVLDSSQHSYGEFPFPLLRFTLLSQVASFIATISSEKTVWQPRSRQSFRNG